MKKIYLRLLKWYYTIYKVKYTFGVLLTTLSLWGPLFWFAFWFKKEKNKIFVVEDINFVLTHSSFLSKLYELNVILENIPNPKYLPPDFDNNGEGVIIDIGAHVGSFSLFAAKKFPQKIVYAFEPDPENYNTLQKNIEINKLSNIRTFNLAVSSVNGSRNLYIDTHNTSGHSLLRKTSRSIEIESINLESILSQNKLTGCQLLKIDCEGGEYDILLNTLSSILTQINQISLEYHQAKFFGIESADPLTKLTKYLQKNGFEVEIKPENFQIGYLWARLERQKTPRDEKIHLSFLPN